MTEDWPGPFDLTDSPAPEVEVEDEETDKHKVCRTCEGYGRIDTSPYCQRRIEDCCGGCDAPCPDCNGKPEREYEDE